MIFHVLLLLSLSHYVSSAERWVKVKLSPIDWVDLAVDGMGQRHLQCGHFDQGVKKFHWRFNGSSILPLYTQIHRHQFTFLKGSNSKRNSFIGYYECCVRESIGNACYGRNITVKHRAHQYGADLSESSDLLVREGDSVYLRLIKSKKIHGVSCTFNSSTLPDNAKFPIILPNSKASTYYHMRIEQFGNENVGEYNCSVRIHKKEIRVHQFFARMGEHTVSSTPKPSLIILILVILTITLSSNNHIELF